MVSQQQMSAATGKWAINRSQVWLLALPLSIFLWWLHMAALYCTHRFWVLRVDPWHPTGICDVKSAESFFHRGGHNELKEFTAETSTLHCYSELLGHQVVEG